MNETEFFPNSKKESISSISMFLDLLELKSVYPLNFAIIMNFPIANPFETIEETKSSHEEEKSVIGITNSEVPPFTNFMRQVNKKFDLILNKQAFEFMEERKLGHGGYGDVYLYSLNGSPHKFAIKFIEFNNFDEMIRLKKMKSLLAESKILTRLDHPNIVKGYFYHKIKNGPSEAFVNFMEYCNSGTLFEFLMEKKHKDIQLQEEEIQKIFIDILKGMQYTRYFFKMREKPELLVHRDLKPDNIFFHTKSDGQKIAKIGDFGLAKTFLQETKPEFSLESSKDYQSPEMSEGTILNEKCDMWSLGVILYFMCFFEFPWQAQRTILQTYKEQKRLLKGKNLNFEGKNRRISEFIKEDVGI